MNPSFIAPQTMLSASKHARREPFRWSRFINQRDQPLRISTKIGPDVRIIRMMVNMYQDDRAVRTATPQLEEYVKTVQRQGGFERVYYNQKSYEMFAPDEYEGSFLLGRFYSNSILPLMKKKILNTIFKQTHVEIDIKSAFPSLLKSAFRDLELPALTLYVQDRESVYAQFPGISEDKIKKMVNSMIGSMPSMPGDFGVGFENMDEIRVFGEHDFVHALQADLGRIVASMKVVYPAFMELIRRKCEHDDNLAHVDGVALSFFCQDLEQACMRVVFQALNIDMNDMVWKFDGAIVKKGVESRLESVSVAVRDQLGLEIEFQAKSLDECSLGICMSPQEMQENGAYDNWKKEFEKKYFRCIVPPVDYRIHADHLQPLNATELIHVASNEPQDFLKKWRQDPTKRQYRKLGCYPPPLRCPGDVFNTWAGWAAADLPEVESGRVMEMTKLYREHVKLLVGGEPKDVEYFHKLLAYKFQNPGFKWRVMPFIRSTPGVGKDSWFKFIEAIAGERNCVRVARISDVMDKTSHLMENKMFVCFSECDYADSVRYTQEIKDVITSDRLIVKRKYVAEYTTHSTACYISFSNNFNAFSLSSDDRRFFPVTASGKFANNPVYHVPLIRFFEDPQNQRAVYQYYMEMDVTTFDPSGDRPLTDTFKEMTTSNISLMDRLLKSKLDLWIQYGRERLQNEFQVRDGEMVLRVNIQAINREFQSLCEREKIQGHDKPTANAMFCRRLLREMGCRIDPYKTFESWDSAVRIVRVHGKNYREFDIMACRKYIEEKLTTNGDAEEDEQEEEGDAPLEFHGIARYTGIGKLI